MAAPFSTGKSRRRASIMRSGSTAPSVLTSGCFTPRTARLPAVPADLHGDRSFPSRASSWHRLHKKDSSASGARDLAHPILHTICVFASYLGIVSLVLTRVFAIIGQFVGQFAICEDIC